MDGGESQNQSSTQSTLKIVPFEAGHIQLLKLQKAQAEACGIYDPSYGAALEHVGNSFTGLLNGRPIICAGVAKQWEGRGLAWALMSDECGPYFVQITRAIKRYLDAANWRRLEAQVDVDFARAIRWAEMLGFQVESHMPRFTEHGRDAFMYVRFGAWHK